MSLAKLFFNKYLRYSKYRKFQQTMFAEKCKKKGFIMHKKRIKKDLGYFKKRDPDELQTYFNDIRRGCGKHRSKKDYSRKIKHKKNYLKEF